MNLTRGISHLVFAAAVCNTLGAQPKKEQPAGIVLESQGASIRLAGNRSNRDAVAGDILFAGDTLGAAGGHVRFLYCPERLSANLTAGQVTMPAKGPLDTKSATVEREAADPCLLPAVEREPQVASLDQVARAAPPAGPADWAKLGAGIRGSRTLFDQTVAKLAKTSDDPRLRLALGVLLENAGMKHQAAQVYAGLANDWKEQPRFRALVQDLENEPASTGASRGKTYALLVGISSYKLLPERYQLRYAAADAELFRQFLKSGRGGTLPDSQIVTLPDGQATVAAIRNQVTYLTQRAGKNDTVILMVAAHGVMVGNKAYIVATNSNPQDYASTSYPMAYIQRLMFGQLAPFARALVFVDVCHSGQIGAILEPPPASAGSRSAAAEEGEHLGLMASQAKESAIEYQSFGGGHGAFTYFLVRGLVENEADADHDGVVTAGELVDYVRSSVAKATWNKQHPKDELGMQWDTQIASLKPAGIPLAGWSEIPKTVLADLLRQRSRASQPPAAKTAIAAESAGPPELSQRINSENEGDDVLLRYQEGDEVPQTRDDFARGFRAFGSALAAAPDSPYLRARADFCEGRMGIFDKRYAAARDLLERSIRMDPGAAFAYNALGIASLEQARYAEAQQAFSDAIRRAPLWAYPRHNLALTLTQMGDYDGAIRTYNDAIALAPQYSYLPYNLGLVYQQVNRRHEAEAAYLAAKSAAPWRAEPDIALGLLAASEGHDRQAETCYREALGKKPSGQTLLTARHNLAVLIAADPARLDEALGLWRQNGDYLPSRLSMAAALSRAGKEEEAAREYRGVLALNPRLTSASLSLSDELAGLRRYDEGIAVLGDALGQAPGSVPVLERMALLQAAAGRPREAVQTLEQALRLDLDPATRKRLRSEAKRTAKGELR